LIEPTSSKKILSRMKMKRGETTPTRGPEPLPC
jgi:hypothetical protein